MMDEPSLGELSRRLDSMERRFELEFGKLGRAIDSLQFVHLDQYRAERDADRRRIDDLEEDRKWSRRGVVLGLIYPTILAVVAVIVLGGAP